VGDDDWEDFEDDPTRTDPVEPLPGVFRDPDTAPHVSPEFLAGREAGVTDGIQAAVQALIVELKRVRCTPEEIAAIATRVSTSARDRV
jgi:hypothetical protein